MSSTSEELFEKIKLSQFKIIAAGTPDDEYATLNRSFKRIADELELKMDKATTDFAGTFHGSLELCKVKKDNVIIATGKISALLPSENEGIIETGYLGIKEIDIYGGSTENDGSSLILYNEKNDDYQQFIKTIEAGEITPEPITMSKWQIVRYTDTAKKEVGSKSILELKLGATTNASFLSFNNEKVHVGISTAEHYSEKYSGNNPNVFYGKYKDVPPLNDEYHHYDKSVVIGSANEYNKNFNLVIPAVQIDEDGHVTQIEDRNYKITLPTPKTTTSNLGYVQINDTYLDVDKNGILTVDIAALMDIGGFDNKYAIKREPNTFTKANTFNDKITITAGGLNVTGGITISSGLFYASSGATIYNGVTIASGNLTVSNGGITTNNSNVTINNGALWINGNSGIFLNGEGATDIHNATDNTTISLYGGSSAGAELHLSARGPGGHFQINANNGSAYSYLVGYPSGYLAWNGNRIPVYNYGWGAPSGSVDGMLYFQLV